jgi:putative ABC transport system permease protein
VTFAVVLATLASHWRRRPFLLGALIAGLALATALWSGVQALNAEARDSYARAAALLGGAATVTLARPEGGAFPEALWIDLRRAGVPASPLVEGRARLVAAGQASVRLVGVEPATLPAGGVVEALGPDGSDDLARLLVAPRRALVAPETLAELGFAEGDAPETLEGAALPPLMARPGMAPGTIVVDIGAAQAALGLGGRLTRLLAPASAAPFDAVPALTGGRLAALGESPEADLDRLTDSFHLNLTAFGFLAFVVGLFIVHGAVGLAVEQRLATVRTLRACGAPARTVALALLAELVALALVAGLIGLGLGALIAQALLPDVAATLRGLYAAPVAAAPSLTAGWWLAGLGMSLVGALAAAGGGVWRLWRLPVLAPAQPGAWAAAHARTLRRQTAAAVAALMAAALAARSGQGLAAGFAVLGLLLVGAALLLPRLLAAGLALGGRLARGPLAAWAFADGRQALPGLSLALMALMLALATNIGVGAMVTSFRDAFAGWLDRRLAAEIYVRVADDAQAAAFEALAPGLPGMVALLPSRDVEVRIGGWPVDLEGLADHATYREAWPFLAAEPGAWDAIAAGTGASISEQLARRLRVGLGATVIAPGAEGPWPLRVVGVHPDYGNPKGQLVAGIEAHRRAWPQATRGAYGLRIAPGATEAALAALRAAPALDGAETIDQAQVKAFSLDVFDRTFAVTAALDALTLGVAALSLLIAFATLSGMRLPQVAPLWAMGATRGALARLEFARTLGLAAATAALAVPLGLAFAWVLTTVVNVRAFGWRLPFAMYPADWAVALALALAAAAAATALPLWRLARTPPARLLAVFAHDR